MRAVTAIFGPPEAGKSTLGAQVWTEYAMNKKGNVAILDTELNEHTFEAVAEMLSKRWGEPVNYIPVLPEVTRGANDDSDGGKKGGKKFSVKWEFEEKPRKGATNILLIQCPEIQDITALVGRAVDIKVTPGGKVEIDHLDGVGAWARSIDDSPLAQFIAENDVKSMMIDSVTNPLDEIAAKTKNFPGRSDLTQLWLVQTGKIAWKFRMPVLAVAHESKNEADGFDKGLKIEGGKGVRYNVKHVLYLMDGNEPGLLPKAVKESLGGQNPRPLADTGRYLFGARLPGVRSWTRHVALDYTKTGFTNYAT